MGGLHRTLPEKAFSLPALRTLGLTWNQTRFCPCPTQLSSSRLIHRRLEGKHGPRAPVPHSQQYPEVSGYTADLEPRQPPQIPLFPTGESTDCGFPLWSVFCLPGSACWLCSGGALGTPAVKTDTRSQALGYLPR